MSQLIVGPLILLVLALLGGAALVAYQLGRLSAGKVDGLAHPEIWVTLQDKIDGFHDLSRLFFKHLAHHLYFYFLVVMRWCTRVFKIISILAERKFSRLIESVHGKGVVGKRGSVSLFLSDLSAGKK